MYYLKIESEKDGKTKTYENPASFESEDSVIDYIKSVTRLFPKKYEGSRFYISTDKSNWKEVEVEV